MFFSIRFQRILLAKLRKNTQECEASDLPIKILNQHSLVIFLRDRRKQPMDFGFFSRKKFLHSFRKNISMAIEQLLSFITVTTRVDTESNNLWRVVIREIDYEHIGSNRILSLRKLLIYYLNFSNVESKVLEAFETETN